MKDMQEYGFFDDLGFEDPKVFWKMVSDHAETHHMDRILAYMYMMVEESRRRKVKLTQDLLHTYGKKIGFYPGVEEWFALIAEEAQKRQIEVEHYIISSGLTEIISKTSIAAHFKKIYACEFLYDDQKVAVWPKLSVNYTMKTQFLFRINKGILEIENDDDLNKQLPESKRPIPFGQMIYIGDGLTDVPSMQLVKSKGGFAVAVYAQEKSPITETLIHDQRVDFVCPADYQKDQRLHQVVCAILDQLIQTKHLKEFKT